MRKGFISVPRIILIFALTVSASSFAYTYVVKPGDTLSKIVQERLPGRVYGREGNLARVLRLNSEIRDPNAIFPGREVLIDGQNRTLSAVSEITPGAPPEATEVVAVNETHPPASASEIAPESESGSGVLGELTPSYLATTLYSKVPGTNREARIASKMHFSLTGKYTQDWSARFKTYFRLSMGYIAFEDPSDPTISITGKSKFLSGFGLGGDYRMNSDLTLAVQLQNQKELFIKSQSTTNVGVDAVMIRSLDVRALYDLLALRRYTLGVSGETAILIPTKTDIYDIRPGALFGGTIYVRHRNLKKNEERFQAEFGLRRRTQSTSLFEQSEENIFFQMRFPIGSN